MIQNLLRNIQRSLLISRLPYLLVIDPWIGSRILFVISLSVGTMFVMWLGEQISLFGIGNGTSMIIFAGIVARFPDDIIKILGAVQEGYLDIMVGILLFVVLGILQLVLVIVATLKASENKYYRYPFSIRLIK